MIKWVIHSKKWAIRSLLVSDLSESLIVAHFLWVTWVICSHHSFLLSNLSHSLTSQIIKEEMSKLLIYLKMYKKRTIKYDLIFKNLSELLNFCEQKSKRAIHSKIKQAICSFIMSDLSESLTSLILVEQPEPFPHITDYKRGNERIAHFFKNVQKTYHKIRFNF